MEKFQAAAITIRSAREDDLPALEWEGEFAHYRLFYRDIYSKSLLGETTMWVVEYPQEGIIGQLFVQFISLRPELADGKERAYLFSFRVRQAYRNQGVGSRLLEMVERDLAKRGFSIITLNVNRDNLDARRFYEQRGYQVASPEAGRWSYFDQDGSLHEVEEPSWKMEKMINHRNGDLK